MQDIYGDNKTQLGLPLSRAIIVDSNQLKHFIMGETWLNRGAHVNEGVLVEKLTESVGQDPKKGYCDCRLRGSTKNKLILLYSAS